MNCQRVESLAEAFLDGELPSHETLEVQAHVDGCAHCAEHLAFSRAIRVSSRALVARDAALRPAFERRLESALAEAAAQEAPPHEHPERGSSSPTEPLVGPDRELALAEPELTLDFGRDSLLGRHAARPAEPPRSRLVELRPWLMRSAMAAAAAAAFWFAVRTPLPERASEQVRVAGSGDSVTASREATSEANADELLDRLIDFHSAPPTTLLREPQRLVQGLERDVGVRMPRPQQLVDLGGRWEGGNLVQVRRGQPAAYLRYGTDDGHRVTLYVYNASRIPLHTGLRPRTLPSSRQAAEPVYVGHRRGYSIAASNRYGVGYAVATDMSDQQSAELVHRISTSSVAQ